MVHFAKVSCQAFFTQKTYRVLFQVLDTPRVELANSVSTVDKNPAREDCWDQIERQLTAKEQEEARDTPATGFGMEPLGTYPLSLEPWLEVTRWHQYLHGHRLQDVAQLIRLPTHTTIENSDRQLLALIDVFDKLIDEARTTILADEASVFDQHRVNSFIRGRQYHRPLLVKLQEGTYKRYKKVWMQLLCFVSRVVLLRQASFLHYVVTDAQSTALDRLFAALQNTHEREGREKESQLHQDLCLELCISLLDHCLKGNVYDSLVVGFLAILGIDVKTSGFRDPVSYTPDLSAFVKLAQILVLQKGIRSANTRLIDFPADLIDEMQDRFMVYGSRSPMNWILKIRSYGCKVRDNTTALGHIIWTDDGEHLSYKNFELSMTALRWFMRDQVELAQKQLHDLLLLPPDRDAESRADTVPPVRLRELKDDPTVNTPDWSFLLDKRNEDQLAGHDRWLLRRIRDHGWLRKQFLDGPHSTTWKKKRVKSYLDAIQTFLQRLLLLVHMTGGQPARGTELLTLQWRNSQHGIRRNIFLENGLVTFVTSYHKGYSITGSTKIIHRYLPPEVSELLVYYLWLVVPFVKQLECLTPGFEPTSTTSSLLWSRSITDKSGHRQDVPWPSKCLSDVLAKEFSQHLSTRASIIVWRHSAIAITRRHLGRLGFKRDYDGKEEILNVADHQAAHSSMLAGQLYARGIEEAPGHIAPIRAEYRAISRAWHSCLGFGVFLGSRPTTSMPSQHEAAKEA